jgi:hypothetical protein
LSVRVESRVATASVASAARPSKKVVTLMLFGQDAIIDRRARPVKGGEPQGVSGRPVVKCQLQVWRGIGAPVFGLDFPIVAAAEAAAAIADALAMKAIRRKPETKASSIAVRARESSV